MVSFYNWCVNLPLISWISWLCGVAYSVKFLHYLCIITLSCTILPSWHSSHVDFLHYPYHLTFSGRCLPPIIIRDSSYYCICVAWELNKSDHWVSGSYPLPRVSKMAVIFYLLNSEEIHFFAPKDCRCNLLSIQIILPLEKTLLQLAWVNHGLINWNIFY